MTLAWTGAQVARKVVLERRRDAHFIWRPPPRRPGFKNRTHYGVLAPFSRCSVFLTRREYNFYIVSISCWQPAYCASMWAFQCQGPHFFVFFPNSCFSGRMLSRVFLESMRPYLQFPKPRCGGRMLSRYFLESMWPHMIMYRDR